MISRSVRDEFVMDNILRDEFVMKDHELITNVPIVFGVYSVMSCPTSAFLCFLGGVAGIHLGAGFRSVIEMFSRLRILLVSRLSRLGDMSFLDYFFVR